MTEVDSNGSTHSQFTVYNLQFFTLNHRQRLLQVSDQVFGMLDANRQPHHLLADAQFLAIFWICLLYTSCIAWRRRLPHTFPRRRNIFVAEVVQIAFVAAITLGPLKDNVCHCPPARLGTSKEISR